MSKAAKRNITSKPNCPALAIALNMDRARRHVKDLERAHSRAERNNVGLRGKISHAEKSWDHEAEAMLQSLALSVATSLEGAIAKAFVGFGLLEAEIDAPHESEWQGDHQRFLARRLMGDFRWAMEKILDIRLADVGAKHWYSPYLEPQQIMAESGRVVDIA